MRNTLLLGDYVFVNKAVYNFVEPKRGDIVVFKYPLQDNETSITTSIRETYEFIILRKKTERRDYIKRVIGVSSDVISGKGGDVYVNGEMINETYIRNADVIPFGPFKVPDNCYFVMGDNRSDSRDSRDWGYVDKDLIRGSAMFVYWSYIPNYCTRHKCTVTEINERYKEELAEAGLDVENNDYYVCDGGGELLEGYYDVNKTNWYDISTKIRWKRILRKIE